MSISLHPTTAPLQTLASSLTATPEVRLNQVEQEADLQSQFVLDAKKSEYKTSVRRSISKIRSTIAAMRAQGKAEYEINRTVDGMLKDFYSSSSAFFEHNAQYNASKAKVDQSNQAIGNAIGKFTLKTKKIDIKKTELAQCMLISMDPESRLGAMPCLDHHSKGLTVDEKKELADFVPNAVIGVAINQVAAIPAVLTKAADATMHAVGAVARTFALGAASEAWWELDPLNRYEGMEISRKIIDGENPEFNGALKRTGATVLSGVGTVAKAFALGAASDAWLETDPANFNTHIAESRQFLDRAAGRISTAGSAAIARWERQRNQWDVDAQENYRTIPGIVKEGISGSAILLPIPAFIGASTLIRFSIKRIQTTARTVVTATRTFYQTAAEKKILKRITQAATARPIVFSTRGEATALLSVRIDKVVSVLPSYADKGFSNPKLSFLGSLPHGETRQLQYLRSEIYEANTLFHSEGSSIRIPLTIKDFDNLARPIGGLVDALRAHHALEQLELSHLKLPIITKAGSYQLNGEQLGGLVAMNKVEGILLESLFLTKPASLKELSGPLEKLGAVLGEIHRKSRFSAMKPSKGYIHKEVEGLILDYNIARCYLNEQGFDFTLTEQRVLQFASAFTQKPGGAGIAMEAGLSDFMLNPTTLELVAINPEKIARSLVDFRWPAGVSVQDYIQIQSLIERHSAQLGLDPLETAALKRAFEKGYQSEFTGHIHTEEAIRFYQLREDLRNAVNPIPNPPNPPSGLRNLLSRFRKDESGAAKLPLAKPNNKRIITEDTAILPQDLGVRPAIFDDPKESGLMKGWIGIRGTTLTVNVDMIAVKKGDLGSIATIVGNLKDVARANNLQTLEITAEFRNAKLLRVFERRYGKAETQNTYQTFRIPVEQLIPEKRVSVPSESKKIIQEIFATATKVPEGSAVIPTGLDVSAVMNGDLIPSYGNFPTGSLIPLERFVRTSLLGGQEFHLTAMEHSFSGNRVFCVMLEDLTPVAVLKEVIATRSSTRGFIPEIVSTEHLQGLKHSAVPNVLAVGKYKVTEGGEKGLLLYEFVPGKDLYQMLKLSHRIPSREVGRALAEINSITSNLPVSEKYLGLRASMMVNLAQSVIPQLEKMGIKVRFTPQQVDRIGRAALQNPGRAGLLHGDPHLGNFIYDESNLTLIDSGALIETVNRIGVPQGCPSFDRFWLKQTTRDFGIEHGISKSTISSILKEFELGYGEIFPLTSAVEADRFAELFWDLLSLQTYPKTNATQPFIKEIAEKIDALIAPPAVPRNRIMASSSHSPVRSERVVFERGGTNPLTCKNSRDFIKLFNEIGYEVVKGGKGSHIKMTRPNSPMVIMPSAKEFNFKTRKILLKTYQTALEND